MNHLCINLWILLLKLWNHIIQMLKEKADFIKRVIKSEEERFHETLEEGLSILNQLIEKAKKTIMKLKGRCI